MPDLTIASRIVEVMNQALEADPVAVSALCGHRVACNDELAKHPTIQVGVGAEVPFGVGLLGILNGIAGADGDGLGYVAAYVDDDTGAVTGFGILERGACDA